MRYFALLLMQNKLDFTYQDNMYVKVAIQEK